MVYLKSLQLDDSVDDEAGQPEEQGEVAESGGGRWGRRPMARSKTQRSIFMPESIAVLVDASGGRPADVIERAWTKHGTAAGLSRLMRSAERGRRRFRVRLHDDVFADMQRAAHQRGWSASELVAAAVKELLAEQ